MRYALAVLIGLAVLIMPSVASAEPRLTKRDAREHGLRFVEPFVDLLDLDRTVRTRMVAPRDCERITRVKVSCRFSYRLDAIGYAFTGELIVRRQRDGLRGFLLPADFGDVQVERPITS